MVRESKRVAWDAPPGIVTRAFWGILRVVGWLLSPLGYVLRIREEQSVARRVLLAVLFIVVLFGLWCWGTNNPEWLNRALEKRFPAYQIHAMDPIQVDMDRQTRQVHVRRAASRADVVVDLPSLAPAAMPPFTPENYPGIFAEATGFGLAGFEKRSENVYAAKVADLEKARTQGGFDPMPFQIPLKAGEPIVFALDPMRGRLTVYVARDSMRKKTVPYQGNPGRLEEKALAEIAPQLGVETTFERKDDTTLLTSIKDLALFRKTTELGPANPIEPLALGEEVLLTFQPQEPNVIARMDRTNKQRAIPVTAMTIASGALPALSVASYPGLKDALVRIGVGLQSQASSPSKLEAVIEDPVKAGARGFGLFRPREARRVPSLPSPTEVSDGLPALWTDRNLAGAFDVSWRWPFVRNLTWSRFRESALFVSLERIGIGFFSAVLVALPLGILMGAFTKVHCFFEPLRVSGLYLPLPAFVPLTLFWAGIGENQKYLFLFICNFVVLLPAIVVAIQSVPQVYLDTGYSLGLTRGQVLRRVLIDVAKPEIFKALRLAFGIGWTWIILAEQIGVDNGLGYIIWTSERRNHPEHVYVVILVIMVLAFLINALWTRVMYFLFPFERSR